jgi:hypothetical protein
MRDSDDLLAKEFDRKKLYDEGRQLFLNGRFDKALERFKRIYEFDACFRDVAEIVEDAYSLSEDEWRKKFQVRFTS